MKSLTAPKFRHSDETMTAAAVCFSISIHFSILLAALKMEVGSEVDRQHQAPAVPRVPERESAMGLGLDTVRGVLIGLLSKCGVLHAAPAYQGLA